MALIKNREGSGLIPKYAELQKVKRSTNSGKNYWNNTM